MFLLCRVQLGQSLGGIINIRVVLHLVLVTFVGVKVVGVRRPEVSGLSSPTTLVGVLGVTSTSVAKTESIFSIISKLLAVPTDILYFSSGSRNYVGVQPVLEKDSGDVASFRRPPLDKLFYFMCL
jgi:hypothetical protein